MRWRWGKLTTSPCFPIVDSVRTILVATTDLVRLRRFGSEDSEEEDASEEDKEEEEEERGVESVSVVKAVRRSPEKGVISVGEGADEAGGRENGVMMDAADVGGAET